MNHTEIKNGHLIDLYLLGRLDTASLERFEEHLIGCSQCADEVELQHAFIAGVRMLEFEDFGTRRGSRGHWRAFALAASLLVAITGPLSIWSLYRLGEVRGAAGGLDEAPIVVMPLVQTRAAGDASPNVIELGDREWLVLELEGDYRQDAIYEFSLTREGATAPLQQGRLRPDYRGLLVMGVASSALQVGNYTITVALSTSPGIAERRFTLRAVAGDTGTR